MKPLFKETIADTLGLPRTFPHVRQIDANQFTFGCRNRFYFTNVCRVGPLETQLAPWPDEWYSLYQATGVPSHKMYPVMQPVQNHIHRGHYSLSALA